MNSHRRSLKGGGEIHADLDHWRNTRTEAPPSYESRPETTAYFGTPDDCIRRIQKLQDEYNVRYFGANMAFGNLEHNAVMRSMELVAEEVIPHFR